MNLLEECEISWLENLNDEEKTDFCWGVEQEIPNIGMDRSNK